MAVKKVPDPGARAAWPPVGASRQHTVRPGESFGTIAQHEGMDPWSLIFFNFRTTNPAEVNWYLEDYLHCHKQTRDGKNYVFSGGETIYVPNSPPAECAGWSFQHRWDVLEIAGYRQWVERKAAGYVGKHGYSRDCADFAVDLVVEYAQTRTLPLAFYSRQRQWLKFGRLPEGWACLPETDRVHLPEYDLTFRGQGLDYEAFASAARRRVVAGELDDPTLGNTVPVPCAQLKSGDLLTLGPPNTPHVQVVLSSGSSINVAGTSHRVVEIVQGNTAEWDWPGRSAGKPIARRAWDLADPTKYYEYVDGNWREAIEWEGNLSQFHCRRWNFENFNKVYGLAAAP